MLKNRLLLLATVLALSLLLVACAPPATPADSASEPVAEESAAEDVPQEEAPPIVVPVEESASDAEVVAENEATADSETVAESAAADDESTGNSVAIAFDIDPIQSSVRFELDEDLRGERITVVGTTDQVSGQIMLDSADLSTASIGLIQIDAASLATDADRRNQAIRRFVLKTGDFETITFTPTALIDLPDSAAAGDTIDFQIEGDLTIRDITVPVTFDATVTATTDNEVAGSAEAVIALADFGLSIPSVPMVANVEDEVELYIDFVAAGQ